MKKKLAVLIPTGIDINKIVKDSNLDLNGDYLKYLIGSIVLKQGKWVEDDEIKKDREGHIKTFNKYFRVKSLYSSSRYKKHTSHIEFLVGNNYKVKRSRTTTKRVNILDRKPYTAGKESFSYRPSSSYFRGKSLTAQYITDDKIIKSMIKQETKIDSIVKRDDYKFLMKSFNPKKLKINLDEAIALCEERYQEHKSYTKYVKELTQILNIYNGIYRIIFKKGSINRLYTNITQLPKAYRKFITYDDKALVEVDLSNSIIYFLGIILNNYTLISNTVKDISIKNINGEIYSNLLMFSKSFESLCSKEIELVHTSGINGTFYDMFIPDFERSFTFENWKYYYEKEFEGKYIETDEQKRKVTKKLVLSMLFAELNQYEEIQEIFKLRLPQFLELLNRFKEENGHKIFSHILFQVEAYYVINVVAREFNKKHYRKAPVFTLHDCLITTFDHKDELEHILRENLSNMLKYAPKTESKLW